MKSIPTDLLFRQRDRVKANIVQLRILQQSNVNDGIDDSIRESRELIEKINEEFKRRGLKL